MALRQQHLCSLIQIGDFNCLMFNLKPGNSQESKNTQLSKTPRNLYQVEHEVTTIKTIYNNLNYQPLHHASEGHTRTRCPNRNLNRFPVINAVWVDSQASVSICKTCSHEACPSVVKYVSAYILYWGKDYRVLRRSSVAANFAFLSSSSTQPTLKEAGEFRIFLLTPTFSPKQNLTDQWTIDMNDEMTWIDSLWSFSVQQVESFGRTRYRSHNASPSRSQRWKLHALLHHAVIQRRVPLCRILAAWAMIVIGVVKDEYRRVGLLVTMWRYKES